MFFFGYLVATVGYDHLSGRPDNENSRKAVYMCPTLVHPFSRLFLCLSLSFSALLPPLRYISRLVSFAFTINSLVFTRCSCVCSSRFYLYFVACSKIHSSHFYCIEKINAFGLIKEFFLISIFFLSKFASRVLLDYIHSKYCNY